MAKITYAIGKASTSVPKITENTDNEKVRVRGRVSVSNL
jgi:hypothetical protein